MNDDGRLHPLPAVHHYTGGCDVAEAATVKIITLDVTLRDWFAGMAMQGLLRAREGYGMDNRERTATWVPYATQSYAIADAMIAKRQPTPDK